MPKKRSNGKVNWQNRILRYGEESPDQLLAHPDNFRIHPKLQQDTLSGALTEIGWIAPVIVSESSGRVIDGHLRIELAISRNEPTVPVAYVSLTEDEERLALATFDPIGALAAQDQEKLDELLAGLETSNEHLVQFMATLRSDEPKILHDDDADLTPPTESITRPGDLWILGDHRLLCGDSTIVDDVRRLMNGERADLFATDPPYLVGYDAQNHPPHWADDSARLKNKEWSATYGRRWDAHPTDLAMYKSYSEVAIAEAINKDAAWYLWHAFRRQSMVEDVWRELGVLLHQQIIWEKSQPILSRVWYMWEHENCFFGWLEGNKPYRATSDQLTSVWKIDSVGRPGQESRHPTEKPVALFLIPIRQHLSPGGLCYEPFAGSGSQIIAAEQVGRRCYAMEIEPVYCDVIVRRWETITGRKAERQEDSVLAMPKV